MGSMAFLLLLIIFLGAAAATWIAGVQLTKHTDVIAERLHLDAALGGLILLAVATNLPELAITISAAVSGDLSIAVGNILGGIALQTVVLVILDVFGVKGNRSLTYRAASLSLVVEATAVIAVLGIVIAGTQMPQGLVIARMTPAVVLIAVVWVVSLALVNRAGKNMPWHENGSAPDAQLEPRGHSRTKRVAAATQAGTSTVKSAVIFGIAALATLIAGVLLEQSGSAMADQIGLSGVLFGATVLALATSLPEISTGLTAVRQGDYKLAISDIFGDNAFLPVLFLVATLISGKSVLPSAQSSDIYLTAIAIVLTLIYLLGILFRPKRKILGMGADSVLVLIVYALSVVGLFAISAAD